VALVGSVSRPDVTDYMSPGLRSVLSPEAIAVLQSTPLFFGGDTKGSATFGREAIWMQSTESIVANHEAMHILSYHTPGMTYGVFPDEVKIDMQFQLLMVANYGDASQEAMTQFSTGMETYPLALQVSSEPWRIPTELKPWYAQWFVPTALVPPPHRWH
jgi:hypothetical protein